MDIRNTRKRLHELRQEHSDLDAAITALATSGDIDQLVLQRMKKRKLMLKDYIVRLESDLIPDIDA